MVVVLSGWLLSAPRLSPALAPLLLVVVLFICGGLLATLMSDDFGEAIMYIAVTGFLALTSVFFAAVTSADPSRLRTVANAYLASALIVALLGIGGYFGALPGSLFTLYGRAKGTFQDPNVFGPFLVLPWTVMLHAVLTRPLSRAFLPVMALAVLSFAILLSFSRAAWGLAAFSGLGVYLLIFIVTPMRVPAPVFSASGWPASSHSSRWSSLRSRSIPFPACFCSVPSSFRTTTRRGSAGLPATRSASRWFSTTRLAWSAAVSQLLPRG